MERNRPIWLHPSLHARTDLRSDRGTASDRAVDEQRFGSESFALTGLPTPARRHENRLDH